MIRNLEPMHSKAWDDGCFHGGAFFKAIGVEFEHLERRHHVINADVLDAWFDPAPKVIAALVEKLPWLLRTSPPTNAEGLTKAIARSRDLPIASLLPGAGSSDLIYLTLRAWLNRDSRVLILDPTYGEYAHVLESVLQCQVDRFPLNREENYRVDLEKLTWAVAGGYDVIVLVNPNSPTGQHIPRAELTRLLRRVPTPTRVWLDETYVDYAGSEQSLESFAAASRNVVVCKSMSKVYALSGVRAAYLCGPAEIISELRRHVPPWAVSLPAQVAAVAALSEPEYYLARWQETHRLRYHLRGELSKLPDWEIVPGCANFLLCHLPETGLSAAELVCRCQPAGLFLRDVGNMGQHLGEYALRISVKDANTIRRMLNILRRGLSLDANPERELIRNDRQIMTF